MANIDKFYGIFEILFASIDGQYEYISFAKYDFGIDVYL